MSEERNELNQLGKFSVLLSVIEVGLGSFLHSFKVPFTGQSLSLNQGFILSIATNKLKNTKNSAALISTTSALLKSLSPAGKKLTPMLAISMQGQLYNLGTKIFGTNLLGQIIGMTLLCLWSFIQPLVIYMIIFGEDLFYMINYFTKKFNKFLGTTNGDLYSFIALVISIKILIGVSLVIIARFTSDEKIENYEKWAKDKKLKPRKNNLKNPFLASLRDLLNPLFIVTIILTGIFYYHARSSYSAMIWELLRPVASGYLIFLLLRVFPIEVYAKKFLSKKNLLLLEHTLKTLKLR